jgi:hypothetical protein
MLVGSPFEILCGAIFPGRQASHGTRTTDIVTEDHQNLGLSPGRLCSSAVSDPNAAAVFLGFVGCLILTQTPLISDKTAAANGFVCAWRLNINKAMCLGSSPRAYCGGFTTM